jgi:hypothetical protein
MTQSVTAAKPVRVSRNGNARTLSIPAEIAEAAHIDIGDLFRVEVMGEALIYRRVTGAGTPGVFTGSGADRVMELPRRAGAAARGDPAPAPAIDWDF